MAHVTITAHYSWLTPLKDIPKEDWDRLVDTKARFVRTALNFNVRSALKLIDEFEATNAWEALKLDRNTFFRARLELAPDDLEEVRKGSEILLHRGQERHSSKQAINAAREKVELAKKAVVQADANKKAGASLVDNINKVSSKGTSASYLLRRLARNAPDFLEGYGRGEFKSVRAAAIAAGIITPKSTLDQLRSWWKKATEQERQVFLTEVTP